jgi:YHS domain-containing protein
MLRALIYTLIGLFVLTFIRMAAGIITKALSSAMDESKSAPGAQKKASGAPGGELKRDPVCGTFVPAATAVKKTVGAEVMHFCSVECRDKYQA